MKKAVIGQSTMEYIIVFVIVVGAIIFVALRLKPKVQSAYSNISAHITNEVQ
jgi:hypothetical protein